MNFEILVEKEELMREFNVHLDGIPSANLEFAVKGASVQIKRIRITGVSMSESKIDATLAILVLVTKDTMLTTVSAEGEIEIDSQLHFTIDSDWQLGSDFKYIRHRWLENPDVNIGLIQFSVKSLIDNIIEKQKDKIEKTIQDQLNGFSDLSIYLNKVLPFVNQTIPFQKSQLHISPNIVEIIIEKVIDTTESIEMTCALVTNTRFVMSSAVKEQAKLPYLTILKNT